MQIDIEQTHQIDLHNENKNANKKGFNIYNLRHI